MINYDQARQNMILGQILPQKITCAALIQAMSSIPREKFVSQVQTSVCYSDQTIEVFKNRYLLAPMIFGRLLQEAHIKAEEIVLDIGFGTGYSSLVLSRLAHKVVGLDDHPSLITRLQQLKTEYQVTNFEAVSGPLEKGWNIGAPYDVIVLEGACQAVPVALMDQLKEGGRLILMRQKPTASFGQATIVTKSQGSWTLFHPFEGSVPLLEEFCQPTEFCL